MVANETSVPTSVPAPGEQTASIVASTLQLCQMILSEQNEGERTRRVLTQIIDEISARFPLADGHQRESLYDIWRRKVEERDESIVNNMHQANALASELLSWVRAKSGLEGALCQWRSQAILRLENQRDRLRSYDKTELKTLEMVSEIRRELTEGARSFRYSPKRLQEIVASVRHIPLQQSHLQALLTMTRTIV